MGVRACGRAAAARQQADCRAASPPGPQLCSVRMFAAVCGARSLAQPHAWAQCDRSGGGERRGRGVCPHARGCLTCSCAAADRPGPGQPAVPRCVRLALGPGPLLPGAACLIDVWGTGGRWGTVARASLAWASTIRCGLIDLWVANWVPAHWLPWRQGHLRPLEALRSSARKQSWGVTEGDVPGSCASVFRAVCWLLSQDRNPRLPAPCDAGDAGLWPALPLQHPAAAAAAARVVPLLRALVRQAVDVAPAWCGPGFLVAAAAFSPGPDLQTGSS